MKRLLASLAVVTIVLTPAAILRSQASAEGITPYTYRPVCRPAILPHQLTCFSIIRQGGAAINPTARPNLGTTGPYWPQVLQAAYNVTALAGSQGNGQVLADVLWHDDPTAESDLNKYRQTFGLPPCTTANGCFKKVNQNGQPSPLPVPDRGAATEWALDIEMFSALCPNCKIIMVEASSATDQSIGVAEDEAVKLGATVISNSYGEKEPSYANQQDVHYNHPGVAITVSSGDSSFAAGPQYPASSQYVTSVGGTSLYYIPSLPRHFYERAWSGAGSGCSKYEPKPSWQTDTSCARRTIADVSAIADPNTGVYVYDSYGAGGWTVVGGTSVAAPVVAGIYALAGNAASVNYGSYPYSHTSSLNDVTTGSNGSCGGSYLCTAKPGYDGPTGLGTPNGAGAF